MTSTPILDRSDVIAAAHMAGQRAAHHRHAGGVLDHVPDPHHGPLLVRQAATAWHQGFAAARAELGKTFVPDLVKVGPEGYIHGYICVRPPCGEKPGHIKAADLAVAKDGGVVHRKTGWAVGHVARDEGGRFVAHHADGHRTRHDNRAAALKAVSRRYNTQASQASAATPATAGRTYTGLVHTVPASNADSIRRYGFQASHENSGSFGTGTYFHTSQADADQVLADHRALVDSSTTQVHAQVTVAKPFVVHAAGDDWDSSEVMHHALESAGLAKPGEDLTDAEVTDRLKAHGYDAVEVKQDGFNDWIGGNQLVVFDRSKVQATDRDGTVHAPEVDPATAWQAEKPAGEGHEETAKRLAAAFRSGEPTVATPSTEGIQAQTTIETFPDGSKWVHKEYPSGTYNPITEKVSKANAIRDLLASQVSAAVGANAPHIVRTSPREVYMPFVGDAKPAAEMPRGTLTKAMDTPAGARIGVFDALTGHQDRHSGNMLIAGDGTPVPIDNNGTWEALAKDGTGRLGTTSPFTDHLLEKLDGGETPISSGELDAIAARMEAIKPAFDQAARELDGLNDDDDTEYVTDLFPDEMFDKTMEALTRLRDAAADAENGAAA